MALITVDELSAFMGKDFTESEEAQAGAIIEQVSAFIEAETGVSFTRVVDDEIFIQADGHGIIELNSKPVESVGPILDLDAVEMDCWDWDGMQGVYGFFPNQTVLLTYTHGYAVVPARIKAVALGAASRVMYNPSGLRQETVGAISVTYPGIGGEAGTINFSDLERKILADFAGTGKSMRLAITRRRIAGLPILTLDNDIN
jgi:hypothetical protein